MFDLMYKLQIIIVSKTISQLISHTANPDHKMPTTFKTSLAHDLCRTINKKNIQ